MRRIDNTLWRFLRLGLAVAAGGCVTAPETSGDHPASTAGTASAARAARAAPPGPGVGPTIGPQMHGLSHTSLGASLRYVTGQSPADPSFPRTQSETAMANGINLPGSPLPPHVMVTAFNDWNGVRRAGLNFDHIRTGSSYLGYSTSLDTGSTWSYRGVLYPFDTANFPVLRGDPSASSSPTHRNYVVVGTLAHSTDQLVYVWADIDENDWAVPPGTMPRGVCVFTSGNGGSTFTGYKCMSNGASEFDGTALAVGADDTIFVASNNLTADRIEVWRIHPTTSVVTLMPRPFPSTVSSGHPQLRFDAASNRLYAGMQSGGQLWMSYWNGLAWAAPVLVNPAGTSVTSVSVDVPFGAPSGAVRQGRFFSFDLVDPVLIGGTQYTGYALRYAFMATMPGGGRGLVVGACAADLTGCVRVPSWEPPASASTWLFDPVVRAYRSGPTQYPQVRLSWLARDSASATTFSVVRRTLGLSGTAPPAPLSTTINTDYAAMDTCPHVANGGGYIGDYNEMVAVPYEQRPGYRFVRAFTWSPDTCAANASGYADDQHVGAVTF